MSRHLSIFSPVVFFRCPHPLTWCVTDPAAVKASTNFAEHMHTFPRALNVTRSSRPTRARQAHVLLSWTPYTLSWHYSYILTTLLDKVCIHTCSSITISCMNDYDIIKSFSSKQSGSGDLCSSLNMFSHTFAGEHSWCCPQWHSYWILTQNFNMQSWGTQERRVTMTLLFMSSSVPPFHNICHACEMLSLIMLKW